MRRATCSLKGCGAPHKAHGLCTKHYIRKRKHGDPQVVLRNSGNRAAGNVDALIAALDDVIESYETGAFLDEIAERYGVARQTVANQLKLRGVPIRRRGHGVDGPTWRKLTNTQIEEIVSLYESGIPSKELAQRFGVSKGTVLLQLKRRNAKRYRKSLRDDHGYIKVWLPADDPFAAMAPRTHRVLEHRLIMARHLGRPLLPTETVHHKNGKRDDNRLENLELRQGRHGNGQAFQCADCGSRNLAAI